MSSTVHYTGNDNERRQRRRREVLVRERSASGKRVAEATPKTGRDGKADERSGAESGEEES